MALSFPSKALQDGTHSATFKIYGFVIGAYFGVKIIMSLLTSVPCCHGLTEACYRWSAVRLVKWMHQVLVLFKHILSSCPLLNLCMQYLLLRISDVLFFVEGE